MNKLIAVCAVAFLCASFATCASAKEAQRDTVASHPDGNSHAELVSASPREMHTVTGVLKKSDSGYYIITGGRTKNRVTWHFVPCEGSEDAYNALSALVGTKVTVIGAEVSRKSNWNITVGVTAMRDSEAKQPR